MSVLNLKAVLVLVLLFVNCGDDNQKSLTAGNQKFATPTATLQTHHQASRGKDAATIKQTYSQKSVRLLEENAKANEVSLEAEILQQTKNAESNEKIEVRNEQITGDAATLEKKNTVTGTWDKIYFVRENNDWKIDLARLFEE